MNDETTISNTDIDLTGTNIEPMLFDKQTVRCLVTSAQVENKDGKDFFVVKLQFQSPVQSTDGRTAQIGHIQVDRILITPTGGLTIDMIKEKLARFQNAVTKQPPGPLQPTDRYVGHEVNILLGVREDTKAGVLRQDVRRYGKV